MNIQDWFSIGMKRELPPLRVVLGPALEFGAGNNPIKGAERPPEDWRAPARLPYYDCSFGTVWANHFFEHLSGDDALATLREVERLLTPGGVANIVVPYYNSQMQAQDLDHKSQWCETTWPNIFNNRYYDDKGKWRLRVHCCFILGIVERNLALFTQLEKV